MPFLTALKCQVGKHPRAISILCIKPGGDGSVVIESGIFPCVTRQYLTIRLRARGCFPLWQRFRKFRLEFKWKGPFRFLPTGIFGITSGGGPLISVGIFRSKFAVPFLTNRFFALFREFGNDQKWQELFLLVGAV